MKILRIPLRNLRNGEFLRLMTDLRALTSTATANTIDAQRDALSTAMESVDELYRRDQAYALTATVEALDAKRDGLLTGLSLLARAFTYHPDAALAEAGRLVSRRLEVYGPDITNETYNSQTATVESILGDFAGEPDLTAAMNTIGGNLWAAPLQAANTQFATAYMQRTADIADAETPTDIKQRRAVAVQAWNALRDKIEGYHAVTDGAAPWTQMVEDINALIGQYKEMLEARAAGEEEEEPGAPGTPDGGGDD